MTTDAIATVTMDATNGPRRFFHVPHSTPADATKQMTKRKAPARAMVRPLDMVSTTR